MHACTHAHLHTPGINAYMHTFTPTHTYAYNYTYNYTYIYTNTNENTHKQTQTHKHTHTHLQILLDCVFAEDGQDGVVGVSVGLQCSWTDEGASEE